MEKIIYYGFWNDESDKDGWLNIIVNINGHDKGNYCYCSLEAVKLDYPEDEWKYVEVEVEE